MDIRKYHKVTIIKLIWYWTGIRTEIDRNMYENLISDKMIIQFDEKRID